MVRLRILVFTVAAALSVPLAGCSGSSQDTVSSTTASAPPNPTIEVTGKCSDEGGFRLKATGFTPNGEYQTQATYPDGRPYNYLLDGGKGRADADGNLKDWTWNCKNGEGGQPDPNGTYHLTVIDLTTHRKATTTFVVDESK